MNQVMNQALGLWDQTKQAADFLRQEPFVTPKVGLVLGSGLGAFADHVKVIRRVPYVDVPHYTAPHVAGHKGEWVFAEVEGVPVVIMNGRLHAYEGHAMSKVTFGMRVLKHLGVESVILTNAAGSLNPLYRPGDFMVIADHINLQGDSPLRGPNDERFGPRFHDMTYAYEPAVRKLWHASAAERNLSLREGVYAAVMGPNYETPAEIRFLQRIGGDAVGMSTVAETIVARHMGLTVAGLSMITNFGAGLSAQPLAHEEVTAMGQQAQTRLFALLTEFIPRLSDRKQWTTSAN